MKTKHADHSTPSPSGKAWFWQMLLPALILGLGTWIVLVFLIPQQLPGDFPSPKDLPIQNAALRKLLGAADVQARSRPQSAQDTGRLGMIYHANHYYPQAESVYRYTLELAPGDYRWPYCMALLKEETGREREVPVWLQKTVRQKSDYFPALQKLADIYYKQDKLDQAERTYRRSAEAGGRASSLQAFFGLGRIAARRGDWNTTVQYMAPLSRENPHLRPLHQLLFDAYTALGQEAQAGEERRSLQEPTLIVIPLLKDPLGEELLLLSCSSTRLLKEAGLMSRFRKPEEAIRAARRAVEVEPTDADAHHFLARTLLEAHGADPGSVDEALIHLGEGLRLRPDDLLPLWYFATFFFRQDKTDAAVEQLRTLLAAKADQAESHYYLGLVADRQGLTEEAMVQYQEAIRRDPQNAEAYHKLGLMLTAEGKLDQAIRYFEKTIALKPMFTTARCNLGIALEQQGKTSQAIAQFEEALRSKPNDALTHQYLGITLLKSGKTELAIRHFGEAIRFAPGDAEAHYGLGCALMVQRQTEAAAEEFRQVLQLQPGHAEALQRLNELK